MKSKQIVYLWWFTAFPKRQILYNFTMNRALLLLLLIVSTLSGFSQKKKKEPGYKEYFMEGSYLLLEDEPELALKNFKKAYAIDSSSSNINYMMGISCLLSASHKAEAEYYLQKSVSTISGTYKSDNYKEKSAPPLSHFFYGKALHFNYKFDEAMKQYEAFKPSVNPKDLEYVKMLAHEELKTTTARNITNFPLNVIIKNLGDSVNSPYPDYSPVLSGDERTLIFTTRRPEFSAIKDDQGNSYEDIVVSYKDNNGNWSKPVPLGINTIGHEACLNLSPDGQTLLVFKNEAGGTNPAGNGNVYYAQYDGKGWNSLNEFGTDVNSLYMESHACLSADGNVLFFSSDRPGGYGGKDIYRCIKLPNGKWSKALNMGPRINTEYDEDGGFIHPDGTTFYYASNGPGTMGGFDVFYATLNEDNKFDNPTNIGYPVNTTDDDIFYVVSPDGKRAYFASAKEGGKGDKDLYELTLEEKREVYLALFKGQILPSEGQSLPENIIVVVKDKETGETIGLYRPKLQNGTFSAILPPGHSYNFSYQSEEGPEFYNEDIYVSNEYAYQEYKREVELEPVRIANKVQVLKNTVELNVQVLDNVLDKKPVSNARVTIEEKGNNRRVFTTNEEGKTEYALLTVDKIYQISAATDDNKAEPRKVSTEHVNVAEKITEVIFLNQVKLPEPSTAHVLDLTVKHPKTKNPIANTTVRLTDEAGKVTETVTDEKGRLKNMALIPGFKYKVLAYKDSFASEEDVINVPKKAGKITKSILLAYNPVTINHATERDSSGKRIELTDRFEFFYAYGQYTIDVKGDAFREFMDELVARQKERGKVTVSITGSASQVPMRKDGGNPALAQRRAEGLQQLLSNELKKRGLAADSVQFVLLSEVGGPAYQGDYLINRKTYEKFQFAKAKIQ